MDKKGIAALLQDEKEGWFERAIVSNAPLIIVIFANLVVIFADYRVYDVMYTITGSWWKSLSASLACAVPFFLWEISWQYNHTTDGWRTTSLFMAGVAFLTSIVLGVADFVGMTSPEWATLLLGGVVVLTGAHTVVAFLYYYNDPDVARRRRKSQALAKMQDQDLNTQVAQSLLESGRELLNVITQLEKDYDPEDVAQVMAILQGNKKPTTTKKQVESYAATTKQTNPTKREQE